MQRRKTEKLHVSLNIPGQLSPTLPRPYAQDVFENLGSKAPTPFFSESDRLSQ